MSSSNQFCYYLKFTLAILLTGIVAGIAGLLLSLLLHFVQHLAFDYSLDKLISPESFLNGVRASAPWRRLLALAICGLIAGIGWWGLFRYGSKLISIEVALKNDVPKMPIVTTFINDILQIVTVGLGSPLGREVAPREVAATMGSWIAEQLGLTIKDAKVVLACGAGAGLAAVYNVPLAGALFTLEALLVTFHWTQVISALFASTVAAIIAWIGLGNSPQYQIGQMMLSYSLVAWAILVGPILGVAAFYFVQLTTISKARAPKNWQIIPIAFINFLLIGLLAIPFPELLGNGKGPLQLGFDGSLGIELVAVLLIIKLVITISSLRAGASGGLLTPGLMFGALLAILIGSGWNLIFPLVNISAFAIVGATAFLAASMKMPLTAIVLMLELTHTNHDSVIPMLFAVIGSVGMFNYLKKITYYS